MIKNKFSRFLTRYFSIFMLILLFGFIQRKHHYYTINLIAIYLGFLLFIYLENKNKLKINNYIKLLALLTGIFHVLFGQYYNFYITTYWFDNFLHLFGTFSFSLLAFAILNYRVKFYSKSKIFIFIVITSIGISIGVIFENLEFILDILLKTKNQPNHMDTNLDLIFDIFGAVLASLLVIIRKIQFTNNKY